MNFAILIAAGDWLSFIVPIVFFAIWAINQLIAATKGVKPPARKPPRPPVEAERPLRQQPGAPVPPKAGPQAQLNAEIEQFLRRANEKRGERQRPAASPPTQTSRAPKAGPKPPPAWPVEMKAAERTEVESVAASVEKHFGSRTFAKRAEHLADDIVRADAQMEDHLQKAFSHRVGTLADVQQPAASTTPVTDQQTTVVMASASGTPNPLVALLADPKNVKQAIIINEILRRPEDRW